MELSPSRPSLTSPISPPFSPVPLLLSPSLPPSASTHPLLLSHFPPHFGCQLTPLSVVTPASKLCTPVTPALPSRSASPPAAEKLPSAHSLMSAVKRVSRIQVLPNFLLSFERNHSLTHLAQPQTITPLVSLL